MLEVSLSGLRTVLCVERDAWPRVKRLRQATHEYAPPPPPHLIHIYIISIYIYKQLEHSTAVGFCPLQNGFILCVRRLIQ